MATPSDQRPGNAGARESARNRQSTASESGPEAPNAQKRDFDLTVLIKNEPIAFTTAVVAVVQAFVALGLTFEWWTWSSQQMGAVLGIATAGLTLAFCMVRSVVTPESKLNQRLDQKMGLEMLEEWRQSQGSGTAKDVPSGNPASSGAGARVVS